MVIQEIFVTFLENRCLGPSAQVHKEQRSRQILFFHGRGNEIGTRELKQGREDTLGNKKS